MELKKFEKAKKIRDELMLCRTQLEMVRDMYKNSKGCVLKKEIIGGGVLHTPVPEYILKEICKKLEMTIQGKIVLLEQQFKEL